MDILTLGKCLLYTKATVHSYSYPHSMFLTWAEYNSVSWCCRPFFTALRLRLTWRGVRSRSCIFPPLALSSFYHHRHRPERSVPLLSVYCLSRNDITTQESLVTHR